jgi:hypothetical protein
MDFVSIILANSRKGHESETVTRLNYLTSSYGSSLLDLAFQTYGSDYRTIIALPHEYDELAFGYREKKCVIFRKFTTATFGALSTLGLLLNEIPPDLAILVTPVDGHVSSPIKEFVSQMHEGGYDAGVVIFESTNPKFSYVRIHDGLAIEVAEKVRISTSATAGIFYFRDKRTLIDCIKWAMLNDIQTNGQFYIAPSLNYLITQKRSIGIYEVNADQYYRFSTIDEAKSSFDRMSDRGF